MNEPSILASIRQLLSNWKTTSDDRVKLQHTYIALIVVLILGAGLVGLVSYSLGQYLLGVAIAVAGVFLVNAVAWSLLQSAVLLRISTQSKKTSRKK